MLKSDPSNFANFIRALPEQIKTSSSIAKSISLDNFPRNFDNILFIGMGGSAIAGDLLAAFTKNEINIPFIVLRDYHIPNFVTDKTLLFASSYSGNTEETLSAVKEAVKKKAQIIAISSGGQLAEFASDKGLPFLKIPGGFPPRQALGYSFFPILHILQLLELIPNKEDQITETIQIVENLLERNDPETTGGNNLANHIAQKLVNRVPIIYTASEFLNPVVVRWRNQFNENSKILAFSNVLPELNHNEIMGWEAPRKLLNCFSVLFLRDSQEQSRNKKRLEITREILRKGKVPIFELFSEGKSNLARIFSHIYLGDWVSYYLALLYGKDPLRIDSIDYLKETLKKEK